MIFDTPRGIGISGGWKNGNMISKNIRLLSLAFLFIFIGFDGVQQYLTTFFAQSNLLRVGFNSLILIYLFFVLSDPISAIFVSKIGPKLSMILGTIFYSLFIFIITSKILFLIYMASALLGVGASLLWTGQNSYLIMEANVKARGTSAGFFGRILYVGSAIGAIVLGFFIKSISFNIPFLIAAFFPLVGLLFLVNLKRFPPKKSKNHLRLIGKALISKTAWRFSLIWFATFFINGLVIGIIPLEINKIIGVNYVGYLSSLFFIAPILFTYRFGKISDSKGRTRILSLALLLCLIGLIFLYFAQSTVPLVTGIVFEAIFFAIVFPLTLALVGDVSERRNLEYLAAFFWMVRNIGYLISIFLSSLIQTKLIYIISVATLGISAVIFAPLLLRSLSEVKRQISLEMR